MARYGRDFGGGRDMRFGNWDQRSGLTGYDAQLGYGPGGDYGVSNYGGWNRGGQRGEYHGGEQYRGGGAGYGYGYRGRYDESDYRGEARGGAFGGDDFRPEDHWRTRGWGGMYNRGGSGGGRRGGGQRLTGMESNRYRGVYGSDFHAWDDLGRGEHGGYRGWGPNRGGGMNPGRGEGGGY